MSRRGWDLVVVALCFTVAGGAIGWIVAGRKAPDAPAPAADHHADHGPAFSAAALANMGVEVRPISVESHVATTTIAAVVVDVRATERPVFAPMGGRVESVATRRGRVVAPGELLATLVRDPLPRPELTLTADILRPAREQLHESELALRTAAEELRIVREELDRIASFTGDVDGRELPLVPRQRAIDLRYRLARAETAYEEARHELGKHGLTDAQITAVEEGAALPAVNEETWQRALERNGLWSPAADAISRALPDDLRGLPWVTAMIGELVARGLATPALAAWMGEPGVGERVLEIGVLLQQGHSVTDLRRLHALGGLNEIIEIRAPELDGDASWDVGSVEVTEGQRVQAGDQVVHLHDPRMVYLRTEPVGGEVATLLDAAERGTRLVARPLVPGSGPVLEDVHVAFVENAIDNEGTVAHLEVRNVVRSTFEREDGGLSRTWALRAGLRYLVHLPTGSVDRAFVLPADAVARMGAEEVVFLRDGDGFRPIPVVVAYRDERIAVIPVGPEVELHAGDAIAVHGAFDLALAMQGGGAVDAHAGHSH